MTYTQLIGRSDAAQKSKTPRLRGLALGVMLASTLAASAAAQAEVLTLNSRHQGWVASTGISNGAGPDTNMYTGNDNGHRINSWISFSIPPGQYSGASLTFKPNTWLVTDPQSIAIFDVSTRLSTFLEGRDQGVGVFQDLGSGAQYGTASLFDQYKTVNLNGNAVFDINAFAGGEFVIGFSNQTLNAVDPSVAGGIYLNDFGRNQLPLELHLEVSAVPEPGTWAMLLAGLGVVGFTVRRRQGPRA